MLRILHSIGIILLVTACNPDEPTCRLGFGNGYSARKCLCGHEHFTCPDKKRHANITKTGGWKTPSSYVYNLDEGLVAAIVTLVGVNSTVIELGAGSGCYVSALRRHKGRMVGYDFNAPEKLGAGVHSYDLVHHADLSTPQQLLVGDWVLSLEVGEHIPATSMHGFVHNLHVHNREGIVLSWATTRQGHGHVNPLSNPQVTNLFLERGYVVDTKATAALRAASGITGMFWFRRTLQVLRRAHTAHSTSGGRSMVEAI